LGQKVKFMHCDWRILINLVAAFHRPLVVTVVIIDSSKTRNLPSGF